MKAFSAWLDRLYYTHATNDKLALLDEWFRTMPDPERGYGVAVIAGELKFPSFKRNLVKTLMEERIDPVLLAYSYDYVGELSETVAHLWPGKSDTALPLLSQMIAALQQSTKEGTRGLLVSWLDAATPAERWAILKLAGSTLRVGVSARLIKQALANYAKVEVEQIERIWPVLTPPYTELFDWIEGRAEMPDIGARLAYAPVMLAHPLEEKDFASITPQDYAAEWKYDGIRIQLAVTPEARGLYTRTGEDISHSFPDVLARMTGHMVVDGELLVAQGETLGSFNDLQQRLGKKAPTAALIAKYPTVIMAYDLLSLEGVSLRDHPWEERRKLLETWCAAHAAEGIRPSPILEYDSMQTLEKLRMEAKPPIEGVMLKRRTSRYVAGRPTGEWCKWKRVPFTVDAVMMYAQRGHGKRSSIYSDFTFGLWKDGVLLPIGKAYFGFTDAELKLLDKFVREHTTERFGPVREVEKTLVLEIAFDGAAKSPRHKSGFALRFPRIHRIRWDKPAHEADQMETLAAMV